MSENPKLFNILDRVKNIEANQKNEISKIDMIKRIINTDEPNEKKVKLLKVLLE